MLYKCIKCGNPITIPITGAGAVFCKDCEHQYRYAPNYLSYDFDSLLLKHFKKAYLLNRVLNNNAYLSYHFLKEGSISLRERQDVKNFKAYILSHIASGRLLDLGCGLLEVPGYLDFEDKTKFEFFGIDPIDNKAFIGMRIVGCGEFMPFQDEQFDGVIFATSLDHLCSVQYTVKETYRVLRMGGKVIVWMSDRSELLINRVISRFRKLLSDLKRRATGDRFVVDPRYPLTFGRFTIYPNYTVLYTPNGAVDPFHTCLENPRVIIKVMEKSNLRFKSTVYNNKDEVFLCFAKDRTDGI